jgi:hypothetical protein
MRAPRQRFTPARPRPSLPPPRPPPPQYEEWEDPSGGLLTEVFDACENDDAGALARLLESLKATQWGVDTHGPDGDTPL